MRPEVGARASFRWLERVRASHQLNSKTLRLGARIGFSSLACVTTNGFGAGRLIINKAGDYRADYNGNPFKRVQCCEPPGAAIGGCGA